MSAPSPGVRWLSGPRIRVVVHWTDQDWSETHETEGGSVIYSADGVLSAEDRLRYSAYVEAEHPFVLAWSSAEGEDAHGL